MSWLWSLSITNWSTNRQHDDLVRGSVDLKREKGAALLSEQTYPHWKVRGHVLLFQLEYMELRGRQAFKTLKKVSAAAVGSIEMKLWLTFSWEVSKCRAGVRLLIPHSVIRQGEEDRRPLWRRDDYSYHWNKCWTTHVWPITMKLSSWGSLNGAENDEC